MNKAPNAFYKKRFPVRVNNEVFVLETDSIILFRIIEGVIFALLEKGKKLPLVEETLNELETKLNPEFFFRINRSEIINARYIESIKIQEGNDYIIQLKEFGEKLSVSSSRINKLKNWLNDPLSPV
ncbi:MAG: LytTR family DNA-binding domain-containing protein [Chitinophagaceae bacterium]